MDEPSATALLNGESVYLSRLLPPFHTPRAMRARVTPWPTLALRHAMCRITQPPSVVRCQQIEEHVGGSLWAWAATKGTVTTMRQGSTVLVVDDDPLIRAMIAIALADDGYHVATASDGADALRKVGEHEPDAIILDAWMPRMDGWEFLALWRTRPAADRAPVLVISAVGDAQRAITSGAQAFLSKPFEVDTLESTLARVIQSA